MGPLACITLAPGSGVSQAAPSWGPWLWTLHPFISSESCSTSRTNPEAKGWGSSLPPEVPPQPLGQAPGVTNEPPAGLTFALRWRETLPGLSTPASALEPRRRVWLTVCFPLTCRGQLGRRLMTVPETSQPPLPPGVPSPTELCGQNQVPGRLRDALWSEVAGEHGCSVGAAAGGAPSSPPALGL